MSNWFQEHPVTTIVGHTVLVATTTWLVSSFVIDENKVNLYRAQAENANAQIKNEKAIAEQYKAKVSILESEISDLKRVNNRYLSWLREEPDSFPSLEKKISSLESQLNDALAEANHIPKENGASNVSPSDLPYEFKGSFEKGGSFVDPRTTATLGVSSISSDYTADGVVYIPGEESIRLTRTRPGETWIFDKNDKKYKLTLESINWLNNSVEASVIEVDGPDSKPNK
ncbi:hypothetical protein ACP86_15870 [Marinobacter sp. CP1]|jgi:hypothetical protein|uniref:hypothetical protein n=1 Tax=unclassified Marinobacter TaxID=83889 RepID=UPI00069D50D7|nr:MULTISPECIES: hypothetical protein [unclassified Marinobacter]AKV97514.1 hypothetical protein ACP86_15870 [Marinobacter sp. CP1]